MDWFSILVSWVWVLVGFVNLGVCWLCGLLVLTVLLHCFWFCRLRLFGFGVFGVGFILFACLFGIVYFVVNSGVATYIVADWF